MVQSMVILKLIDVVETLTQFDRLLEKNSAIDSGINLGYRSFAALVHELCDIEMFTGMREDVFGDGKGRLAKHIGE